MIIIPAIYKNNVKYGGGSSSSNINITTTLTENTVSDTSVPSSKAVYGELQNVDAKTLGGLTVQELTSNNIKNLIPYPYVYTSREQNGLTWTDNGDGTVSVSGANTVEGQNLFNVRTRVETDNNKLILQAGTYTISGCPSGSTGHSDWYIQVGKTLDDNWSSMGNDYGNGVTITLTEETQIQIQLVVRTANEVNLIFKPMIEVGLIVHDYVPYNYGNADTLDGKHASYFAPSTHFITDPNDPSYSAMQSIVDENIYRLQIQNNGEAHFYTSVDDGVNWDDEGTVIHSGNVKTYVGTNVDKTSITSFTTSTISGTLTYQVKNGVAFVTVCPIKNSEIASDIEVCELPTSNIEVNLPLISNTGGDYVGIFWMNANSGKLMARFFKENTSGYATFSYPVAE